MARTPIFPMSGLAINHLWRQIPALPMTASKGVRQSGKIIKMLNFKVPDGL